MSIEVKSIYPNTNISKNGIEEVTEDINIVKDIQNLEVKKTDLFIPRLRYFAVGPTKHYIKCPICGIRDETYNVSPMNAKDKVFAVLSCFSACIPIFWIPFFMLCIAGWTRRRRQFCSNCGAQMGFHFRPS